MWGDVEMRTLYATPDSLAAMPQQCRVLSMSALLRELILQAVELPMDYGLDGRGAKLFQLCYEDVFGFFGAGGDQMHEASLLHQPSPLSNICGMAPSKTAAAQGKTPRRCLGTGRRGLRKTAA